ncbi:hypothetical protein [Brumimicrobium mesophilum]|uniref:hypothetical protein n=1 Tax=Brumimicrobium mesophilum TaxID=392717 RepID=UPI00131AB16D|nr:hypothetical protein [Brumimicrobium mesophilum]
MADSNTVEHFDALVRVNQKVYRHKCPKIKEYLKERKRKVRINTSHLTPSFDSQYKCNTCNTKGKSNPETGYCIVCDTDNWEFINN